MCNFNIQRIVVSFISKNCSDYLNLKYKHLANLGIYTVSMYQPKLPVPKIQNGAK